MTDATIKTMGKDKKLLWCGMGLAVLFAALDQIHKWIMLDVVDISQRPPIEVTPFFNLVMVWNRGVSFGMFSQGEAFMRWVLAALAVVICIVMLCWLARAPSRFLMWVVALITGGAVGNIIDRVRFGAVADFFDFHLGGYHWPAFNIADSLIFIGVALLVLDSIVGTRQR